MKEIDEYFMNFIWNFLEAITFDLFTEYSIHLMTFVEILEYISLFSPKKFFYALPELQNKFVRICEIGMNSFNSTLLMMSMQAVFVFLFRL